jgi:2,4-dienoyl-CoA reductase-like NADH-dependent reductase (Old Yellow Enzyme family)/nucleotide-binding universal stress UspA family protein/Tfp pilus assembly protein PilZ
MNPAEAQPTRRRHERRDFFRQLQGRLHNAEFFATIRNLSLGGICFEVDYLFRTGQDLQLLFKLSESEPAPLKVEAEVMWVQPAYMLFHRVGARFKDLTPDAEAGICRFVSRFKEGLGDEGGHAQKYRVLLSPFSLCNITLKNRLTMAPMFWGYANEDGTVSLRLIDAYREIANGGVGMIVVANAIVEPSGVMASRVLRIDHDRFIPGLAKLAEAIKACGVAACLQINHGGRWANVEKPLAPSPLVMEVSSEWEALDGIRKEMSKHHQMRLVNKFVCSFMRCRKGMTGEQIDSTRESFGRAALRAKTAGFDIVELHGATGYLLSQFISPRSNKRCDAYGGSLENRMRFPLEVVETVKGYVGDETPVGYRLLADEWLPAGFGIEEAQTFVRHLEKSGISYVSVTAGTYESFFLPEIMNQCRQEGHTVPLASKIKRAAPALPVIVAGRIVTPFLAEEVLRDGAADLIGLARALFRDPLWPKKVSEGREHEILCCTCCNACLIQVIKDEPVVCVRWDMLKRAELKLELKQKKAKWEKILIAMGDSERSLEAVEYAAHMIGPGKKVTLFSIVTSDSAEETIQQERQSLMAQARGLLESAGIRGEDIDTKILSIKKGIERGIVDEIEKGGYGSVILGKRGVSRTHEVLFGSISNHIIHHAKRCGIWIVD